MNIKQSIIARIYPHLSGWLKLYLERKIEHNNDQHELKETQRIQHLQDEIANTTTIKGYLQLAKNNFNIRQIFSEITGLIETANTHNVQIIGEIGTFECGNLFLMSHAIKSAKKVVAIDLVFRHSGLFKALARSDQIFGFFQGYSTDNSIYKKTKHFLGDDKFDLLFIDGDHSYEGVKADFEKYRHLVREGGLIIFHDIVPDVTTRMKSDVALSKAYAGGVPIFWSELKCDYKYHEFINNAEQDGYGIGMIEYSEIKDS